MNIIPPGEPVPPGYENEAVRVAEIQPVIERYKGNALVGLEYTVELYEEGVGREPSYFCVLCDKRGDPRTIMQHWTSHNHRFKYLQRHYPTVTNELNAIKYQPNSHGLINKLVQSLTEAIENQHGRLTLPVYSGDEFRRNKAKIITEVNESFHFDELNGQNFLNVITSHLSSGNDVQPKKLEQTLQITIKAPKHLNQHSLDTPVGRADLDEISSDSDGPAGAKRKRRCDQAVIHRNERSQEMDSKLPTPKELSLQASQITQERYKWEKYHCMLEIQMKQMTKTQEEYEKNPEKHPLYPQEWKKFWNRRYKELQAEKKTDPNKYDYKPQWITFWTKRMQELFDLDVQNKKKEIKVKLGLPEDAEEKNVDQLKEKYKVQVARNPESGPVRKVFNRKSSPDLYRSRSSQRSKSGGDVIHISDDDVPMIKRSTCSRSRSPHSSHSRHTRTRTRSRSISPFLDDFERQRQRASNTSASRYNYSRENSSKHSHSSGRDGGGHYRVMGADKYPKYERSLSPHSKSHSRSRDVPELEDEGPLNIVIVLRLLTALEDHLGSLGPKVLDLLGKALALEKIKANSADEMLLNDDNSVFLETVKEKLKGMLMADVIEEQHKIRAIKRAIQNIATLLHQMSTKSKTVEPKDGNLGAAFVTAGRNALRPSVNKIAKLKDLPIDRDMIATQLAAELVKQEVENVSTEEMDKLIYFFILMAKLSVEKCEIDGQPIYTKDLLKELDIEDTQERSNELNDFEDNLLKFANLEDISAYMAGVGQPLPNETKEHDDKNDANNSTFESLTDSDLKTLLQNFKQLSTEEQHHLIAHLKKLESTDMARVERLRKFVNVIDFAEMNMTSHVESGSNEQSRSSSRNRHDDDSPKPSTSRRAIADEGPEHRRKGTTASHPNTFSLDDEDDDDDYYFDEVVKAASSNVNRMSEEKTRPSRSDACNERPSGRGSNTAIESIVPASSSPTALTFKGNASKGGLLGDTQNIVANLMGSLQQSNASKFQQSHNSKPPASAPIQRKQQLQQQHQQQNNKNNSGSMQSSQMQIAGNMQSSVNVPYFNQMGQHPQHPYNQGYNQLGHQMPSNNAYSAMNGPMAYNNQACYPGYQAGWCNGSQMPGNQTWPQNGMANYMGSLSHQQVQAQPPQQQQQQQQQLMGYGMYGGRNTN